MTSLVRRTCGIALAVLLLAACSENDPVRRAAIEELMRRRSQIDALMMSEDGPLTASQRSRFKGLAYFPPNFDLLFDLPLQRASLADTVRFLTSKNTFDAYLRLGTFDFEHGGRTHTLTLYRAVDGGSLFLPFADRTSGEDTYGAGRYLDPQPLADGRYRLDFNRAYNPYCAYNAEWVCPLPPPENVLDFPVRAGERNFPYGHD